MAVALQNSVRLIVDEKRRNAIGLQHIVRKVIQEVGGVDLQQVFAVQDFSSTGTYDITFHEEKTCQNFFEKVRQALGVNPALNHLMVVPLFGRQEKPLTVHLYNPFTDIELVKAFLHKYCVSVKGGVRQHNQFGIFNSKVKFWIRLKLDPNNIGGVAHPPANFNIAGNRGFLFYPGQPKYCRDCHQYGHVRDDCVTGKVCRNCKASGHEAGACPQPRVCDVCGSPGHTARDCDTYALYTNRISNWVPESSADQPGGTTSTRSELNDRKSTSYAAVVQGVAPTLLDHILPQNRNTTKKNDETTKMETLKEPNTSVAFTEMATTKPEEKKMGTKPEVKMAGKQPEEKMAGKQPEEKMEGNAPEVKMAGNAPEVKMAGNPPEANTTVTNTLEEVSLFDFQEFPELSQLIDNIPSPSSEISQKKDEMEGKTQDIQWSESDQEGEEMDSASPYVPPTRKLSPEPQGKRRAKKARIEKKQSIQNFNRFSVLENDLILSSESETSPIYSPAPSPDVKFLDDEQVKGIGQNLSFE